MERAGNFPDREACSASDGFWCPASSPGLCQVPAVMSRIQAEAGHMVLRVSLLIPLSTKSWRHRAFLYLRENIIALDLTGRDWPLTHHHTALWNEASAVVFPVEGEGGAQTINMAPFKCQTLQFRSDLRFMGNATEKSFLTTPTPHQCYKTEYVVNPMHGEVHGASVRRC